MSPALSRTFTKKPVNRVEATAPEIDAQDQDEDTRVIQAIDEIESDPEKKNRIKAAVMKIRDAMRHKSPEEREELLKGLATMDGTESVSQTDGTYKKKHSKARFYFRYFIFGTTAWCVGTAIVHCAIFLLPGAFVLLPFVAIPVLVIALAGIAESSKRAVEGPRNAAEQQTPNENRT